VGAVIALAIAKNLRAMGREVGPLIAFDGAPEIASAVFGRWTLHYLLEVARNLPGWTIHADLMRSRSIRSLIWSISNNAYAISRALLGLKRGEKLGGGYSILGIMDVSRYQPAQKSFINRLFAAPFAYVPEAYSGAVVVYEAKVTPLLYLPQIGRTWSKFAPQSEIVRVVGTHIGAREAYAGLRYATLVMRIATMDFFPPVTLSPGQKSTYTRVLNTGATSKVFREIKRPVFSLLENGALSESCSSSLNRVFFIAPSLPVGAIVLSINWSDNQPADQSYFPASPNSTLQGSFASNQ
jgi:hypothetical protein